MENGYFEGVNIGDFWTLPWKDKLYNKGCSPLTEVNPETPAPKGNILQQRVQPLTEVNPITSPEGRYRNILSGSWTSTLEHNVTLSGLSFQGEMNQRAAPFVVRYCPFRHLRNGYVVFFKGRKRFKNWIWPLNRAAPLYILRSFSSSILTNIIPVNEAWNHYILGISVTFVWKLLELNWTLYFCGLYHHKCHLHEVEQLRQNSLTI